MNVRRAVLLAGQVCLLLLVAVLLFVWWKVRPPVIVSDDAIDDLIEEVGDTYVPVHVGEIQRGTLRQYLIAYGTVQPAVASGGGEAGSVNIASPSTSVVQSVNCREGAVVGKGQPLFTLDSRAADATVQQAERLVVADQAAAAEIGKPDAATPLWRIAAVKRALAGDQATLDRARSARETLTIVAPIAGTITSLNIAAGETARPDQVSVQIVDLDRLVVAADVPAARLAELRVGQSTAVDVPSSGHSTTQPAVLGQVALVDAAINPTTGMGSVDIAIPAGSSVRPGQFVRARITTAEVNDRLIVPVQSITQNQNGDPAIGKIEGDLRNDGRWADLVPVKTGWRDGENIEITGVGLDAGQSIVTIGASGLIQRTRLHLLRD